MFLKINTPGEKIAFTFYSQKLTQFFMPSPDRKMVKLVTFDNTLGEKIAFTFYSQKLTQFFYALSRSQNGKTCNIW